MKLINPYPLRIDEELMEELKEMAEAHSRSPSLTLVAKNPALGPINPSFFIF